MGSGVEFSAYIGILKNSDLEALWFFKLKVFNENTSLDKSFHSGLLDEQLRLHKNVLRIKWNNVWIH